MAVDHPENRIAAAREHLARTRERLREGRRVLDRLHASIDETNDHIRSMSSWIEENERALAEERRRRCGS